MPHCRDIKHRKRTYLARQCPMTDRNKAIWKHLIFQDIFRHLLFILAVIFLFCFHNFLLLRFFLVKFMCWLCFCVFLCVWCAAIFSDFFFFCDKLEKIDQFTSNQNIKSCRNMLSKPLSQPQLRSQKSWFFWLAPRIRDLWEKSQGETAFSHSGYSLYTCSETIIELECMHTIKPEPGISGSGFWYWPEQPMFINYRMKTCGLWDGVPLNLDKIYNVWSFQSNFFASL